MAKLIFGLGLATSLAMLAIAMLGTPATHASRDSARAAAGCSIEALPLDEGYGVSRTVPRRNCAD
jgi:hypothetical protein